MAKYRVLERLSSLSTGEDILPGEVIEIDDDQAAALLLEKGCITPAVAPGISGGVKQEKTIKIEEEK